MLGGVSSISGQLASIYRQNENSLVEAMKRISSGKRIMAASDDFSGYIRSQALQTEIDSFNSIKANLQEAKAGTQVAIDSADQIVEYVSKMSTLVDQYAAAAGDATKQAAYLAEFNALKSSITSVRDNAKYDGISIYGNGDGTTALSNFIDVDTTPTGSATTTNVQFKFTAATDIILAADITAADITDSTTVDTLLTSATTMLTKAQSFDAQMDLAIKNADTLSQTKAAAKSLLTDIDDATEQAKLIDLQVRQQATVSMLAQANLSRQALMQLYS